MIIKNGTRFIITYGAYSDYTLDKALIAVKDFDPRDYVIKTPDDDAPDSPWEFGNVLISAGVAKVEDVKELHIGDTGHFVEEFKLR